MSRVLFPGSFDPITKGHMNIIEQAINLFDEILIAPLDNSLKKTKLFTLEERKKLIQELYKNQPKIKVLTSTKPTIDIATQYQCQAIIRGIRNITDYDYELQLQQINKDISNNQINTILLFADKEYQFISSTIVKQIFNLNKNISKYVSPIVEQKMLEKGE